ncbi:hypothetical protein KI387_020859, partial [Taxus chinensis]
KLGLLEMDLGAKTITITSYDNEERESAGTIIVPMEVGPTYHDTTFHVLDIDLPYNTLLGHPWIHAIQAIPSTFHQCIKLCHEGCIVTISGDLEPFTHCR